MRILIFDNYDSFTYNIAHAVARLGYSCDVRRNDKISLAEIEAYDKIILSPGPGLPSESGIMPQLLERYATTKSILGICLGEQAIGERFGARLRNLSQVMHGVQTTIGVVADDYIFNDLPRTFPAGRYHSWVVDRDHFPGCLVITAVDEKGEIMGIRHRSCDAHGIQFHPESVMTPDGLMIINNFLTH